MRGIVVPEVLLPKRRGSTGLTTAAITLEQAAKLEGARMIEQTVSVMVAPPAEGPAPLVRATDAKTVQAFTEWMKSCRVRASDFGTELDFQTQLSDHIEDDREIAYRFMRSVRQDGVVRPIGSTSGSLRGSSSGGMFPSEIVTAQPFELIFDPASQPAGSNSVGEGRGAALLWARFTLRFASATAAPEVVTEALPETPILVTTLPREEARKTLEKVIADAYPESSLRARSRMNAIDRDIFSIRFGSPRLQGEAGGAAAEPIMLSGVFEVRAEGSLLSPSAGWTVALSSQAAIIGFPVSEDTIALYPRTVRYTPNLAFASSQMPMSFRYIAEPFELRFTDAAKAPEIVWLAN